MGRELDLLVAPFGSSVVAGDQSGAVDAAEVPVDERVAYCRAAISSRACFTAASLTA
jgi:hypothetical protein